MVGSAFLRRPAVLVDVKVIHLNAAVAAGAGVLVGRRGIEVFAEQVLHVVIGLNGLRIIGGGRQGDHDADRSFQSAQIGHGLGGERIPAVLAEVEAPVVVQREIVEAAEQGQEQNGLEHQIDGAKPAGSTVTLDR